MLAYLSNVCNCDNYSDNKNCIYNFKLFGYSLGGPVLLNARARRKLGGKGSPVSMLKKVLDPVAVFQEKSGGQRD